MMGALEEIVLNMAWSQREMSVKHEGEKGGYGMRMG